MFAKVQFFSVVILQTGEYALDFVVFYVLQIGFYGMKQGLCLELYIFVFLFSLIDFFSVKFRMLKN